MRRAGTSIPFRVPTLTTVVGPVVVISIIDVPNGLRDGSVFEPLCRQVVRKVVDGW